MKRIILSLVATLFVQCVFAQAPIDTLRQQQNADGLDKSASTNAHKSTYRTLL